MTIDNCQLEIDSDRGVLYVHGPEGFTLLRMCGLLTPVPDPSSGDMLDITLKGRLTFSWHGERTVPAPVPNRAFGNHIREAIAVIRGWLANEPSDRG